ncbi:WD40 repeat-like protein [Laetiporus sulphureus 93-53]|uniref:WD40 repeat-like protein n=1 Tax=Laetiporus sulphureus 93-53 TaxID=1314785 RepID=A0A165DN01_9APHY|nr:WD40 repeat-like protein [Laetiporus sulphureus 93-53]KZT05239.1 WD40 repeat-like protein [Laetiporus sulphureus 93-53]
MAPLAKLPDKLKPSDDTIDMTLAAARSLFSVGENVLTYVPVPGLEHAATALVKIIDAVQVGVARNEEEQREYAEISRQDQRAGNRVLSPLSPLVDRIERLTAKLNTIAEKAQKMNERSRVGRLLKRKKDAEILQDLGKEVEKATKDFRLEGGIAIEALLGTMQEDFSAMRKFQMDDHDRMTLDRLPHVSAASHRSGIHESKARYLPGTREDLMKKIEGWAKGASDAVHRRIYILSGAAGTGKSTIACEVARRLERDGLLGASFFFARGSEQLATTRLVFTTIAHQLASHQPDVTRPIVDAAGAYLAKGSDPQQMEYALDELIIGPLRKLSADHPPIVIVIDALDECTDAAQELVPKMLYLFAARIAAMPFPLRVFITSRPDYHIEHAFDSVEFKNDYALFKLQDVPKTTVSRDIERYLTDRISRMPRGKELLNDRPSAIFNLTKKADGLFIFASTATNFLNEDPDCAIQRLEILLADGKHDTRQDLSHLDQLYALVLRNAYRDALIRDADRMRKVNLVLAAIALLQDHLTINAMASLISIPVEEIRSIIRRLASVILLDADDMVRPLHASFPQFLTDPRRCADRIFYVDPGTYHAHLSASCLSALNNSHNLKRNLCRLPGPTMLKIEVNDISSRVSKNLQAHVQYACTHWAAHVCSTPPALATETLDQLRLFLTEKLLFWFEALSLMNRLEITPEALLMVRSWYQHCCAYDDGNIESLIDDAYHFILEYFDVINACPEHIYISALPTMPCCKLLDTYMTSQLQSPGVRMLTARANKWSACIRVIEGIAKGVRALAYSANGRWIVAGINDGTVRSWDARSGIPLNTMARHRKPVTLVDISPDNTRIVSYGGDIRVWNLTSGALLCIINTNNTSLTALSFSSDGKKILSTVDGAHSMSAWDSYTFAKLPESSNEANDSPHSSMLPCWGTSMVLRAYRVVHILDIERKEIRRSLRGHSEHVTHALFFPGGDSRVLSCAASQVKIWDVPSERCLKTLETFGHICSIAISPGGDRIAAGCEDRVVHAWDAKTGDRLAVLRGHLDAVKSICFSPAGDRLTSGGTDRTIRVWDLMNSNGSYQSDSSISPPEVREHRVMLVVLSEDGELAASAARNNAITIWHVQSGTPTSTITQSCAVAGMAFSPNNKHIAVIWFDGTLETYNVEAGHPIVTTMLLGSMKNVQYSSSGRWLAVWDTPAAAYGDCHLHLYTASDLTLPATTIELKRRSTATDQCVDAIEVVAFSPDDSSVCAQTIDGSIFLWDCHSGKCLSPAELNWIARSNSRPASIDFRIDNGWVIDGSGRKVCWVTASRRPDRYKMDKALPSHGCNLVIGAETGIVTILDVSE